MSPHVENTQLVAETVDPEQQTPKFCSRARHDDTPLNPSSWDPEAGGLQG